MKRLRISPVVRRLVRETSVSAENLILPLFVRPGKNIRKAIASMPGQYQLSIDGAVKEASDAWKLGIPGVILFGIPSKKDDLGSEAYDPSGIVQNAIRAIK